jgi:hypothetical protein
VVVTVVVVLTAVVNCTLAVLEIVLPLAAVSMAAF